MNYNIKQEAVLLSSLQYLNKIAILKVSYAFSFHLLPAMRLYKFEKHETIYRIDDSADEIFFLVSGSICLVDEYDTVLLSIKEGSMFGEIEVLQNKYRTDSCKASDESLVLLVEKNHFLDELNNGHDALQEEIAQIVRTKISLIQAQRRKAEKQRTNNNTNNLERQESQQQQQQTQVQNQNQSRTSLVLLEQQSQKSKQKSSKAIARDSLFAISANANPTLPHIEQIQPLILPNSSKHFKNFLRAYNAYKERITKKKVHIISASSIDDNEAVDQLAEIAPNVHISSRQLIDKDPLIIPAASAGVITSNPNILSLKLIQDVTGEDENNSEYFSNEKDPGNQANSNQITQNTATTKPKLSKFSQSQNKNALTRTSLSIDQRRESSDILANSHIGGEGEGNIGREGNRNSNVTESSSLFSPPKPSNRTPYVKSKDAQSRSKVVRNRKQTRTLMGGTTHNSESVAAADRTPRSPSHRQNLQQKQEQLLLKKQNRALTHVNAGNRRHMKTRQENHMSYDDEEEDNNDILCRIVQHQYLKTSIQNQPGTGSVVIPGVIVARSSYDSQSSFDSNHGSDLKKKKKKNNKETDKELDQHLSSKKMQEQEDQEEPSMMEEDEDEIDCFDLEEEEEEGEELDEIDSPFTSAVPAGLNGSHNSILQAKLDKIKKNLKVIASLKRQYANLIRDVNIKKNTLNQFSLATTAAQHAGRSKTPSRTHTMTYPSDTNIPNGALTTSFVINH